MGQFARSLTLMLSTGQRQAVSAEDGHPARVDPVESAVQLVLRRHGKDAIVVHGCGRVGETRCPSRLCFPIALNALTVRHAAAPDAIRRRLSVRYDRRRTRFALPARDACR